MICLAPENTCQYIVISWQYLCQYIGTIFFDIAQHWSRIAYSKSAKVDCRRAQSTNELLLIWVTLNCEVKISIRTVAFPGMQCNCMWNEQLIILWCFVGILQKVCGLMTFKQPNPAISLDDMVYHFIFARSLRTWYQWETMQH